MIRFIRNMMLLFVLSGMTGFSPQILAEDKTAPLPPPSSSTASESNPLVVEMKALDTAFRDIISAVALGNGKKVQQIVAATRGAEARIQQAPRDGTMKLPKNAGRVKDFLDRNHNFFDKLDALERAARHNNQREMQRITTLLLNACVQCHQTFKK